MSSLLELRNLTRRFGGLVAVEGLSFSVLRGEIVGIIGPNGAGKTTVFNMITGFLKPSSGQVYFQNEEITGFRPEAIAARGLVRTFQSTALFSSLPVLDNVLVGLHLHAHNGLLSALLPTQRIARQRRQEQERAMDVLSFLGLGSHAYELAKNLPHGHQRVLGLAIALAAAPQLLLLDEPMTGMDAQEVAALVEAIQRIRQQGTSVLLVEHNVDAVQELCDRVAVLHHGQKIAEGSPRQVLAQPAVVEAYLGTDYELAP